MEKILRMRLEENKVDVDIVTYVKSRLETSSIPPEQHYSIQAAVPGNANGLFLYAKLAMDAFLKEDAKVGEVLENLPLNLNIMYSKLLREHATKTETPTELQLLILQWATHATRPLRLIELADMINITQSLADPGLKAAKGVVRSACGPLLEILLDETLCVVHHSLTEFLNGTTRTSSEDYPILDVGLTHNRLAVICLLYLQSGCLEAVQDTQPQWPHFHLGSDVNDQLLAPFTKYAASNWHIHARKSTSHSVAQRELNDMLDKFTSRADFQKWAILAGLRFRKDERRDKKHCIEFTPVLMAVTLGLTEYLKLLLSRSGTNLTEGAPICYAADKGYVEIVDLLISNGADSNQYNADGYTPLHLAAKNNHAEVVSLLLRTGCDRKLRTQINYVDPGSRMGRDPQYSALWYACNYGHVATTMEFFSYVETTEEINKALFWAVESEKSEVVEKILEHPLLDLKNWEWASPLYTACSKRDLQTMKLLIAAGVNPNKEADKRDENTPLHALSEFGGRFGRKRREGGVDPEVTKACFSLLIGAGAEVNSSRHRDGTPLHVAADAVAAEALIAAGADVESPGPSQETPVHTCSDAEVLRVLVKVGKADIEKTNRRGLTPLLATMDGGTFRSRGTGKIFALLELGANASAVDEHGDGAIHYALKNLKYDKGLEDVIHRLCKAGADVNLRNHKNEAPIHLTAIDLDTTPAQTTGRDNPFQALVEEGADLTPRDDGSKTPLFNWINDSISKAKKEQLPRVSEVLATCGARFDTTDDRGRSLLHAAVSGYRGTLDQKEHIQFLIDNGLDPQAIDNEGNTLWHEIVPGTEQRIYDRNSPHLEIFNELLRLKVDPKQPNHHGRTPLHILSSLWPTALHDFLRSSSGRLGEGHTDKTTTFDVLLSYKQDVNYADKDGITALHLASTFSEYQTRRLLESGANVSCATREGCNALHIAARSRMPNIVGMLLEHLQSQSAEVKASILNAKDAHGRTSLYYAFNSASFEAAKLLIDFGADVDSGEYQSSPWEGFARHEKEIKTWSYHMPNYREFEGAGGVLLGDKQRSAKSGRFHKDRIEELIALLTSHNSPEQTFIDKAIKDAAQDEADYTVECLLHARASLNLEEELLVTPPISESIDRRQAEREAVKEPCKNCNKVHTVSRRQQLLRLQDYQLLPEAVSTEEQLQVHSNSGKGATLLHNLISDGFALTLSRMLTPEKAQKFDDRAWCEKQESSFREQYSRITKGSLHPLLLTACERSTPNMDIIRLLVEQVGVNVNAQSYNSNPTNDRTSGRDPSGESALHVLVRGEQWWHVAEALPYLLEHGANTELRDSRGMTPLNAALHRCGWLVFNKRAAELLIRHGADVNTADLAGNSCLAKALFDMDIARLLLDRGAVVTHDVFAQVIKEKNIEQLNLILSRGADPNVRGISMYKKHEGHRGVFHDELYPLHLLLSKDRFDLREESVRQHYEKMVALLLEHGADPSARYDDTTIFHEVIREGNFINPLLVTDIPCLDLEARDSLGETPILAASHARRNRDTNQENAEGRTVINLLMLRGANIRAKDNHQNTILHHYNQGGLFAGNSGDVKRIVSSAPELINQPNNASNTPLLLASARQRYEVIDLFLANGGDVHILDGQGNSVLHLLLRRPWQVSTDGVVKGKLHDVFHRVLSLGADINARKRRG